MPINKQLVEHIAQLARIELTEEEVKKFQHQLSSILGYVDKLKKVKTDQDPFSSSSEIENRLRKDQIQNIGEAKELIKQAPDQKNNYFKVKAVLKKDGNF